MDAMESEGKTVAAAVECALKKTGLRRDQVEVQILEEGSGGFLGLGAKPARVRLSEKRWGEAAQAPRAATPACKETAPVDFSTACVEGSSMLKELLGLMGIKAAEVASCWDARQERAKFSISSPDCERIVGQEGKTLESLQFLFALMLNRKMGSSVAVLVDAQGFCEQREKNILDQALRGVEEVKRSGKPFRLSPMDASLRRLIHRSLAGHSDVETSSEGEGSWRKIVLRPRRRNG